MENPSQKCEICAEAGPNQTKLPRHYIKRKFKAETHLDLSGADLCDKCLLEIERDVYSVKELTERWTITCEYDKCTQPANFYSCTWQYLCYMCYVRTYCQIHCSTCNIPHKCKDIDCVETLAKANKMVYE